MNESEKIYLAIEKAFHTMHDEPKKLVINQPTSGMLDIVDNKFMGLRTVIDNEIPDGDFLIVSENNTLNLDDGEIRKGNVIVKGREIIT